MAAAEEFFAVFETAHVPQLLESITRLQTIAGQRGMRLLEEGVGKILLQLIADLHKIAVEGAGLADEMIKERIEATRAPNRPAEGEMATHIRSEPGPLGSVGVGAMSELDKIINPEGEWGPFWRAQEYGTGGAGGVPTQIGRRLYGTFEPSGEPPREEMRGLRVGTDLAFYPGGANPGLGRITVDLPPRFFLHDGASLAAAKWLEMMNALQDQVIRDLEALHAGRQAVAARTFIGRVDA